MGASGHILEKKRTASPKRKRVHFFHFQGNKGLFFRFQGVHFMLLLYWCETPKIEPGLGLPLLAIRIN